MKIRIALVVVLLTAAGCGGSSSGSSSDTQTGKFTAQDVTFSLSDAMRGALSEENISATGRIVITKDNGEEVMAFVPNNMLASLRGQQTLEIKKVKINGSDEWVVSKILKQP